MYVSPPTRTWRDGRVRFHSICLKSPWKSLSGGKLETSTSHNSVLRYRPDIDGLRAVAVLAVIVFHIDERWLPGGFLGVDVFFVISGYLITLLLLKGIEKNGQLDLVDFYRRRLQRIVPALLFMLLLVVPVGFAIMAPMDFRQLLLSALASVLSLANIFFYRELDSGYFAAATDDVPLLHVWSLGVEEQFYMIWPFLLILLVQYIRRPRVRVATVFCLIVLSLGAAQWAAAADPSFAYYLLPTRMWELLAGCLAAFLAGGLTRIHGWVRHVPGLAGLAMLSAGITFVNEDHLIPGVAVIPVVLGAVLLVLSPGDALAGRLLSIRSLVGIGLVSYSAYLWHWPILAFLRYAYVDMTGQLAAGVIFVTFAFAVFSYFFVERPLRRVCIAPRKVFTQFLAVLAILAGFVILPLAYVIKHEVTGLYEWDAFRARNASTLGAYAYDFNCQYAAFDGEDFSEARCVYPVHAKPRVLLAGDSNAAHYLGMLRTFAERGGFAIRNASQSSCPPLFEAELDWIHPRNAAGCDAYRRVLRKEVHKYDVVVLGGSWTYSKTASGGEFYSMIERTVREIAKQVPAVIVLAKAPTFPGYDRECELREVRMRFLSCAGRLNGGRSDFAVNNQLRSLSEQIENVHFFDPRSAICKSGCSPYLDGQPLYFNATHISMEGSRRIGEWMWQEQDKHMLALLRVIDSVRPHDSRPHSTEVQSP